MQHGRGRCFDVDQVWEFCLFHALASASAISSFFDYASCASAAVQRLGYPRSHDLKVASLRAAFGLAALRAVTERGRHLAPRTLALDR